MEPPWLWVYDKEQFCSWVPAVELDGWRCHVLIPLTQLSFGSCLNKHCAVV